MVGRTREQGLSEVIGFLMIVSLLTILFSMYLLYVVPIQGRDAEISHMKYITQEFIGLKADLDGLIINDKVNMPIARSFELGTLSSVGSGSLSILPMSSFIEATGLLMVNEQNDFLSVTVNGDLVNLSDTNQTVGPLLEIACLSPEQCPAIPKNYTINDRYYNVTIKPRYSLTNQSGTLAFSLPHVYLNMSSNPAGSAINTTMVLYYNISSYDLVLETRENSTSNPKPLFAEKTIIENLTFGRNYTYNILKDNDLLPNNSTDYYQIQVDESIIPDKYAPQSITTKVGLYPPRIGSFQYESSNRYWINQNLLYEMGGLFLSQPADGGSSVMLIPSIALTPILDISTGDYNLKVSVNNIRITDTEDISGSVSAQIFSKVDHINQNLFNGTTEISSNYGTLPTVSSSLWKMREGEVPNARAVWLQFVPDDPRVTDSTLPPSGSLSNNEKERMKTTTELWKRGFDQIKTITNKTLSDDSQLAPLVGKYSNWMYNFRIEDGGAINSPPYSANMVIGEFAPNLRDKCPPITYSDKAANCRLEVENHIRNPTGKEFILDYTESEISLVMQSGAL